MKTADPTELPEPGGSVTFTIVVTNTSTVDDITIDTLTDSIYVDNNGHGDCPVPQTILSRENYSCSITVDVNGNAGVVETNVATASGTDDDGNAVSDIDAATVTITDTP